MIWSLIKVLLFITVIAAIAIGAGILLDTGEGLRVAIAGWEFTMGPLQAVIVALLLVALMWLLMKLVGLLVATLRFVSGDETAINRYFRRNDERKGYQALSDSLLALASGEPRTAMARANRAERYLGQPHLTTLLVAQAAEQVGDAARAEAAYKELLKDDRTRFVGVQGLLKQTMAEGDMEASLKLAEKAYALKPRHPGTQDTLLKLQSGAADWKGARATLGAQMRSGALPRDVYRRRDAVLALQEASAVLDDAASIEAREAAIEANRLSPDLIPAAAMAARSLTAKGDKKGAARVLKKAWGAAPHPDLAAAFAEIEPEESPSARVKRFAALVKIKPDHEETKLLLAELNIAAEDFPAARRALGDLPTTHPTRRSLALMAAVERGEGSDEQVVRGWLAKALTAPRGPQWCCDKCQAIHSTWGPVCSNCGGFDTLSWREPPEQAGPSSTGAELLPILVGARKSADAEPEEARDGAG